VLDSWLIIIIIKYIHLYSARSQNAANALSRQLRLQFVSEHVQCHAVLILYTRTVQSYRIIIIVIIIVIVIATAITEKQAQSISAVQ